MARTLYVASSNPGKLRDFRVAAAQHDIDVLPLPGLEAIAAPPEDAPSFEENALEKAIYYSQFLPVRWCWPTTPGSQSMHSGRSRRPLRPLCGRCRVPAGHCNRRK